MKLYEHEEEAEILLHDEDVAFLELAEEATSLQQQRLQLDDQHAFLDLQRKELEQQLFELKLQYALLDTHYARLGHLEQLLISEYEIVRMCGKRWPKRS